MTQILKQKQMRCETCGVRMGLQPFWKKKCLMCWKQDRVQNTVPKPEVEHMSKEVHEMILRRIAERKQKEKGL